MAVFGAVSMPVGLAGSVSPNGPVIKVPDRVLSVFFTVANMSPWMLGREWVELATRAYRWNQIVERFFSLKVSSDSMCIHHLFKGSSGCG